MDSILLCVYTNHSKLLTMMPYVLRPVEQTCTMCYIVKDVSFCSPDDSLEVGNGFAQLDIQQ